MSSINSLASLIGNSAAGNTTASSSSTTPSAANTLTANDFIQFLVTELQNQDPLNPTDSNQMLSQMSQIGQLESATNLQTSLTGMVQQNQIAAASSMIGKAVQGTDVNKNPTTGVVAAVQVNSSGVNLLLTSGVSMPMSNVTMITNLPAASGAATSGATTSTGTPAGAAS
jgi:flagellar basal-body rod modification protein FlgD